MNRDKGMAIEDNARWLEENRLHLCHWFTVDDLMHCTAAAAFQGVGGVRLDAEH